MLTFLMHIEISFVFFVMHILIYIYLVSDFTNTSTCVFYQISCYISPFLAVFIHCFHHNTFFLFIPSFFLFFQR